MSSKNTRGSEWRKWDLHVHTPASLIQQYNGQTNEEKWERFISHLEALPSEFSVIGVNDYLFIDGYEKVLEYKKQGRIRNISTILPVIEFRIKKFGGNDKFKRVNFHVIFSNELKLKDIKAEFLSQLQIVYEGLDFNKVLNPENLIEFGQKLIDSIPEKERTKYGSPLIEGFNNCNFEEDKIRELLNKKFKGKYLTAIGKTEWDAIQWNDNTVADKKDLIKKADIVFTASESIEAFYKAKKSLTDAEVNDNLLDCSDAHDYSNSSNKDRIGNCFTWIKADPTFEGLKQIIREPEDRVYIGALPPKLGAVRDNSTVYLSQVSIKKKDGATIEDIWFDNDIPLNVGMVSIIGNKGSGKSALADILALAGNSQREDKDFSFLTKDRFRKDKKANDFEVTLTFEDGTSSVPKFLSDNSNTDDIEQVHYIPQAYIERVCTDIEGKQFQSELRRVIFSHLPDDYKLGQETLDALIEHKTKGIYNRIDNHNLQLSQLNSEIIALEEKTTSEYKDKLQSELKQKERELDAHRKSKPAVVDQPQTTGDNDVKDCIEKERENLININEQIGNNKRSLMNLANQIDFAKKLDQKITDFDIYYNKLVKETEVGFEELEINFSEVINYSLNKSIILQKLSNLTTEKININNTLSEEEDSSLIGQKNAILKNIDTYQKRLDAPNKAYQLFLDSQQKWKISKNGIESAIAEIKSKIEYAENQIKIDLQSKKEERKKVTHDIHAALSEIKAIYKELYAPVQELIKNGILFREDFKLAFDSSIFEKSFNAGFFDFISHTVRGSFTGKEEGIRHLEDLKDGIDFNKSDNAVFFVENVMEALQKDKRPGHGQFLNIKTQLKKDKTVNKLYDYLWSLDYLKPDYSLKLDGKDLEQLSPGERGTLLLVFYLLVDKSNKPIIIDQPEENLDNQTIYNILIPVIKAAKKRRQIIMVTHNPNLAVVCDSEQIIHASIDKKDGNRVTYISGSIESPEINKHLINVLEGTRPAFDNRNSKYRP